MKSRKGQKPKIQKKSGAPEIGGRYIASQAGQLGLIIAIPLVGFIALGVWLGERYGSKVMFVIGAVVFALTTSSLAIAQKLKNLNQDR